MKNIKIAGVVILYEPTDEDIDNINSYLDSIDVLYVMDNSKEENKKRLPKNKKIVYIFNHANLGISEPLNKAADIARKENYSWLLTLDQDTNIPNTVVTEMKKKASEVSDDIAIITPWHKTKLKIEKSKTKIDYPLDVMTSGNLINLEIHKKIGGFKEWLFIDGVDIEYCLNLRKHHYKVMRLIII